MARSAPKAVWLDCDPGHDDAIALLLALFAPKPTSTSTTSSSSGSSIEPALNLLGVSTVHGNATGACTYFNAVRLLVAYNISPNQVHVWRGANIPLLRQAKVDADIHGDDGLGGVECLPNIKDERVQEYFRVTRGTSDSEDDKTLPPPDPLAFVSYMLDLLKKRDANEEEPLTIIVTGPLTNIAMLIRMCPGEDLSLLIRSIDKIVIMGGAAGVPGNRTPLAEWNIMVDPEAASIVFDSPLPVVMAGLNITHQAIFTPQVHREMLLAGKDDHGESIEDLHRQASPLQRLVSSALTFFASTYASEFGFTNGPPVHDMLTVAYVIQPSLFTSAKSKEPQRYRVKIDTSEGLAAGTTVVDFHEQWGPPIEDTWRQGGRNAIVLEKVDTIGLWRLFLKTMECASQRQNVMRTN